MHQRQKACQACSANSTEEALQLHAPFPDIVIRNGLHLKKTLPLVASTLHHAPKAVCEQSAARCQGQKAETITSFW